MSPSSWYKDFMAAHGVDVGSRAPERPPPRKPATLAQLHTEPYWLWFYCRNHQCRHRAAVPLAPFIIRWGPDVDIVFVRERVRCAVCGTLGPDTVHPSWSGTDAADRGWQPFPVEHAGRFGTIADNDDG